MTRICWVLVCVKPAVLAPYLPTNSSEECPGYYLLYIVNAKRRPIPIVMTSDEPYWHVTRANNKRNTHSLLGKKLGLGVRYQLSLGPENQPLPRENMVLGRKSNVSCGKAKKNGETILPDFKNCVFLGFPGTKFFAREDQQKHLLESGRIVSKRCVRVFVGLPRKKLVFDWKSTMLPLRACSRRT